MSAFALLSINDNEVRILRTIFCVVFFFFPQEFVDGKFVVFEKKKKNIFRKTFTARHRVILHDFPLVVAEKKKRKKCRSSSI